jgi:hypothetical protein
MLSSKRENRVGGVVPSWSVRSAPYISLDLQSTSSEGGRGQVGPGSRGAVQGTLGIDNMVVAVVVVVVGGVV